MSQVLDTGGIRPPVSRRGARPARYDEALRARQDVTAVSTLCAGRYCLQRSLATALLCRMRGH